MPGPSNPSREIGSETTIAESRLDSSRWHGSTEPRLPALTILAHPEIERVGARVLLPAPRGGVVELGRGAPVFSGESVASADEIPPRPLDEPHLSRRPIYLVLGAPDGSIAIHRPVSPSRK